MFRIKIFPRQISCKMVYLHLRIGEMLSSQESLKVRLFLFFIHWEKYVYRVRHFNLSAGLSREQKPNWKKWKRQKLHHLVGEIRWWRQKWRHGEIERFGTKFFIKNCKNNSKTRSVRTSGNCKSCAAQWGASNGDLKSDPTFILASVAQVHEI